MGLISVMLPTRNRARMLGRAMASIQAQTWRELEILVLDDGSQDETPRLLERLSSEDRRIRWQRREVSKGLADALNTLIASSRGRWLARMDDDDWSHPQRLARQLAWMRAQKVDVAGTWYRRRSALGRSVARPPCEDSRIRMELLFQPPMLHPSVMMRRDVVERVGGYPPDAPHAEDYALWVKLAPVARFGNVPEVLFEYTLSARQVSRQYKGVQVESARRVRDAYLRQLGIVCSPEERTTHIHLRDPEPIHSPDVLDAIEAWLWTLAQQLMPEAYVVLARQWLLACVRAAGLGPWVARRFARSAFADGVSAKDRFVLTSLCHARLRYRGTLYRFLEPFAPIT
ncbi:glycosyltransferase family 2 protein [Desulfosoma caldarium]|uniref:Glycosyltransferase involved in cell wall biosynthesis n=1 Tax=Desulfosoma caldarium TaxID=610254 RepID=A0A3N1UHP2_9BACT|nr:glycosyltransferase family A protein [Desulfosoma caldarium]ROQ90782.1 glycosyltransferase involved in cell wall biosynthesis [Desulfosoma caldarium]